MSEEYIIEGEDGAIEILEEGYISTNNIDSMKFEFAKGQDITESLAKKQRNSKIAQEVSALKKGRTGYTPIKLIYPNGKNTSVVFFTNCVVQYRQGIGRNNSEYAETYVCIGIPSKYINKIKADAKKNSAINVGVKDSVRLMEGCYWFSCTLANVLDEGIWFFFDEGEDGDGYRSCTVREALELDNHNLVASISCTISGSMATEKLDQELDLENGIYTLTIKPHEIFFTDISDKRGPELEDTNKRSKEKVNKSEALRTTNRKLIELVTKRLNRT